MTGGMATERRAKLYDRVPTHADLTRARRNVLETVCG
jgi:hypothetical protein